MVIKIAPKFTADQLRKMLQRKLNVIDQAYFQQLQYIGEAFVKHARESGNYTDRTGNLRNSIGYVILKDGKQLIDNFINSSDGDGKTENSRDGQAIGRQKAAEIGQKFPKGYVLICVAGMEYAAAVESKGFDVITSSSITAKNDLIKAVEGIYKRIQKL